MAKRGGARAGAGRKIGSKTQKTIDIALNAAQQGVTPLEYMLDVMRAPLPMEISDKIDADSIGADVILALAGWHNMRFEAAKASAPFMHPRLQTTVLTGKDGGPIKTEDVGSKELARRLAFVLAQGANSDG